MGRYLLPLLLLILTLSPLARAEYRVFLLRFVDKEGKVQREFPSTLDPLQFGYYHQIPQGLSIEYTKTWMCKGDTSDFTPLCKAPDQGQ